MNGTQEEVQAACCADEQCVAVNYKSGDGSGDLCASTELAGPTFPPLDPILGTCFSPPQPNLFLSSPDPDSAGAGYATLDEAAKACLSSPRCGAVMFDASTATYSTHLAGEEGAVGSPLNQYTVWRVLELCDDMVLVCSADSGKYTFAKSGKRGLA